MPKKSLYKKHIITLLFGIQILVTLLQIKTIFTNKNIKKI